MGPAHQQILSLLSRSEKHRTHIPLQAWGASTTPWPKLSMLHTHAGIAPGTEWCSDMLHLIALPWRLLLQCLRSHLAQKNTDPEVYGSALQTRVLIIYDLLRSLSSQATSPACAKFNSP